MKLSSCLPQPSLLLGALLASTCLLATASSQVSGRGLRGAGAWARVPTPIEQAPPLAETPEVVATPRVKHLPVSAEPWSYVPSPDLGHCLQTYRLFLPSTPFIKPEGGWPVVVHVKLSGFRQTPDTPDIDDTSLLGELLHAGIAVVAARVTPSIDTGDPLWSRSCDGVLANIPGQGLFHPPGVIPPDLAATGIAPYENLDYDMAEKDAVMLLQHVRFLARQAYDLNPGTIRPPSERDLAMAELDHRLIGVHGVSAGGMALMWASVGPDRRDEAPFAGRTGQWAETSRPDIAAFERAAVWWPAFHEGVHPPTPHFGFQGHSSLPAQTIGACAIEDLVAASPLAFGDAPWIAELPLYLSYDEPSRSSSYEPEPGGCAPLPFCYPDQGLEGIGMHDIVNEIGRPIGMHPAWSGYAWKARFPSTRLTIRDKLAYEQRGDVEAVPFFSGPNPRAQGQRDMVAWFAQQFEERRLRLRGPNDSGPDRWRDVGYGLCGSRGVPQLRGTGSPGLDGMATLHLDGAAEDAPVVIIAGPAPRYASQSGGIVVPQPTVISLGLRTDASGSLQIQLPWTAAHKPAAEGSADFFQVLIQDPAASEGFAFSNALALRPQQEHDLGLRSPASGPQQEP